MIRARKERREVDPRAKLEKMKSRNWYKEYYADLSEEEKIIEDRKNEIDIKRAENLIRRKELKAEIKAIKQEDMALTEEWNDLESKRCDLIDQARARTSRD